MRRSLIAVFAICLSLSAPALASNSGAQLWSALHGKVVCGIAIHPANTPPTRLLCSATRVPAPKRHGTGDPGFVFLGSNGQPVLARLSQDSFAGLTAVPLASGHTWAVGPLHVTCAITAAAVRCTNLAHHGFTITTGSYQSH